MGLWLYCFYYSSYLELVNYQCLVWVWLQINSPGNKYCSELKTLLFLYFYFMFMHILPICVHVYHFCKLQKRMSDTLELELSMVVNSHLGAGNWALKYWANSLALWPEDRLKELLLYNLCIWFHFIQSFYKLIWLNMIAHNGL